MKFKKMGMHLLAIAGVYFFVSVQTTFAAIDVNTSFSPGTVYPSQTSQLVVRLQNSALSPALNTVLSNTFPNGVFISVAPSFSNTCGGTLTYSNTATGGVLSLTGGTIPAGDGTNPGSCIVQIDTYAAQAGTYINTINIGEVHGEVLGFSEANTQISQGTLAAIIQNVTITQTSRLLSPTGIVSTPQGDEISYHKVTFSNPNPINLTQATFPLTFDPSLIVYSSGATTTCGAGNFSFSGNTVIFSGGTIPAKVGATNGTCEVNIQIKPARSVTLAYARLRPYVYFNAGDLTTKEGGTNAATTNYRYDIYSGIITSRYYGASGANTTQTIDINSTNTTTVRVRFTTYNTQTISDFSFLDAAMPAGMSITGITGNTCGGSASIIGGNRISLSGATLSGASYNVAGIQSSICEIAYTVQVSSVKTYTTSIVAGSIGGYQYATSASSLVVTGNPFDMTIAYQRATIYQGDTNKIIYTLINRDSTNPVQNIDFIDLLSDMGVDNGGFGDTDPIFKVSNKYSNATTNCSSGTIIAPVGATSISLQDFVVAPNSTCTVNVEVTADTDAIGPTPTYNYKVDTTHTNTVASGTITYDPGTGVRALAKPVSGGVVLSRFVVLSKAWTPTTVGSNGISRLRINIQKRSMDQNGMYNIRLVDPLPSGFTVAPVPNISNGCAGTVIANPGDPTITLSGGYMNPNTGTSVTCSIYVNVKTKNLTPPNTTEIYTNTIPGNAHGNPVYFFAQDINGKPIENQNYAASASITLVSVGLTVNTEFLQSNINGGAVSRIRTTISNTDPAAIQLTGLSLVDTFPTGMQLYSNVNPIFSDTAGSTTGNCNSAIFSVTPGSNAITLSNAKIAPGTVCYFEYNVTALVGGNHINTIEVGDVTDNEGITNTNSVASTLTVGRQLNVGNGFSPTTIQASGSTTLTITIYNTQTVGNDEVGTNTANGDPQPALRNTLPIGMTIVGTPTTTCVGGTVTKGMTGSQHYIELNGGTFVAESQCTITATINIIATGIYTNTIPINALTAVSGSKNPDQATASVRVINKPTISKAFSPTAIAQGGTSTLSFTLSNSNSSTLLPGGITGVSFSDTLTNMEIASPLTVGGTCAGVSYNANVGDTVFQVTDGKVPAGGSCTITVLVTSSTFGDHSNQATGLLSNETQTVGTPSNVAILKVLRPISITKAFSPTTVSTGQASRLTFTLSNQNSATVSSLYFYDLFPAGMQVAPIPNITESCVGSPVFTDYNTGLSTASGDTSVEITGGSISANSSCTVSLNVVTTASGNLMNTVSPVSSSAGVSATGATATILSLLNTPPTITLVGSGSITIEAGTTYTDSGATAFDDQDGDLTSSIIQSGAVNTSATGTYVITYDVMDLGGMVATQKTRTITVVDTTPPAITLFGSGTLTIEVGTSYTDPGATCTDNLDISCTVTSSGSFDTGSLGTYTITYTATDITGNMSTITRTITVVDTTPPVITLTGANPLQIYRNSSFTNPGATCTDNYDPSCSVTYSGSVDTSTIGTYTLTYTAIDASGNTGTITRTVQVVAGGTPILSLLGPNPYTLEVFSIYTDSGATASDTEDGNITSSIISSGSVNTGSLGTYTITYNVTDSSSNSATPVTRTISVVDTTKPVITLLGSGTVTVVKGYIYTDAGATASDNYDGNITSSIVVDTGSVDTSNIGVYPVYYNVTDSSANSADRVIRYVQVVSGDAPILTLLGSGTLSIEVGSSYTDSGATASDTEDGNITSSIISSGSVNTASLGTYTITYNVTDSSSNSATPVTRTISVVDTTKPVITLQGAMSMQVYQNTVWSDPGYSCADNYDTNCVVFSSGIVDMSTPGVYTLSYTATDISGNSETVQRTVEVITGATPIITLLGSGNMTLEVGTSYTEAGATAIDTEDGDITSQIVITGTVDTSIPGVYVLTYDVIDSHGHRAAQVIRTITIRSYSTSSGNGGGSVGITNSVVTVPTSVTTPTIPTVPTLPTPISSTKVSLLPTQSFAVPAGKNQSSQNIYTIENRVTDFVCPQIVQVFSEDQLQARDIPTRVFTDDVKAMLMFRGLEKDEMSIGQTYLEYKRWGIAINDSTYEPYSSITRAEYVKMLVRALSCRYAYEGAMTPFSDVGTTLWYAEYIRFAYTHGWINGYDDGTFRPNSFITRAEAAKILANAIKLPTKTSNSLFTDVLSTSVFAPYITALQDNHIITGRTATTYAPDDFIPRTEASRIIYRTFLGGNP